jgi:aminoglycoside phosphotransferase (APT) family kinase protein
VASTAQYAPVVDDLRLAAARRAAAEAAVVAGVGLEVADLQLARLGTSVLLTVPDVKVMIRVDDRVPVGRATRHVAVTEALHTLAVPAVRLLAVGPQPVSVTVADAGSAEVTFWHLEDLTGAEATPAAVGRMASRLHRATTTEQARHVLAALPPFDPFLIIAEQLAAAAATGVAAPGDLERLAEVADGLSPGWPTVTGNLAGTSAFGPVGVVHGDLHADNVLMTPRGPVLADLELAGVGPVHYDLVAPVVAVTRYGMPRRSLARYATGYGAPVPGVAHRGVLRDTYELWLTTWAVANAHLDARHAIEAQRRMARWRSPQGTAPRWTLR